MVGLLVLDRRAPVRVDHISIPPPSPLGDPVYKPDQLADRRA
jgi:hypothetical protein